jgi:hypothetical protein
MNSVEDAETVEKLADYMRTFVGSTGGGQYSFQLLCGRCSRQDTVSASRTSIRKLDSRNQAARKLVQQGWAFSDRPLCPKCSHQQ